MTQMMEKAPSNLVKQTPFEVLAVSLCEDKSKSDIEIERKRQIIKEIISVYCFMKKQFGIRCQPLDLEKFEVIREQLYKTACEEIEVHKKKWRWLGLKPPRIKSWESFLRFGYFNPIRHPSGLVSYRYLLSLDLETIFNGGGFHPSWDAIPMNLKDLTLTLFKERFGEIGNLE